MKLITTSEILQSEFKRLMGNYQKIHDNVIGMYIEKYYFKLGSFGHYWKLCKN